MSPSVPCAAILTMRETAVKQISFRKQGTGERLAAAARSFLPRTPSTWAVWSRRLSTTSRPMRSCCAQAPSRSGDAVEFCVPTGDFGDILAGYYAKRMGLPVAKLLVASDKNNVLADFWQPAPTTASAPSTPPLPPRWTSWFPRTWSACCTTWQTATALVADLMSKLTDKGNYQIPAELLERIRAVFDGGWADEDQVAAAIRRCWDENGYVIDPHTACGYHVMEQTAAVEGTACRVLLATASP